MAKRKNETFSNENLLSRGKSELKCRSFAEMYTHLVAVGLGVEEQDVELREEINERERKKKYQEVAWHWYTVKIHIQEHPFSGFRLIGFLYIGYFR